MVFRNPLKQKLTSQQLELSRAIYNIFGIKTGNIYIYELAFRHKSVAGEVITGFKDSYERLEFLGDSILGAVVAEHLFKKYPFKSEGFLTDLRSKIVCGKSLTRIALKLGLDKLIHIHNHSYGNALNSAHEDVVEAVIGAMFIDKGFEATKKIIIDRIITLHVDIETLVETETNFKSRLIEWAQKEKRDLVFNMKETRILNSQKQYVVEVVIDGISFPEAIHNSIKESEQQAAQKAIEILKGKGQY